MDVIILAQLDESGVIPPSLLPVQPSWTTEPWEVRISRFGLNPGLVPQAYASLPDAAAKTREVIAASISHRRGVLYMYTKGVKEDVVAKSGDSILCSDESLISKLVQYKILNKPDTEVSAVGSMHKRDGMVLYQAIFSNQENKKILLFHLHLPYNHSGQSLLHILHSGIVAVPMGARDAAKASKDPNATSLIVPDKATLPVKPPTLSTPAAPSKPSATTSTDTHAASSAMSVDDNQQTLSETDILKNLPQYLVNARHLLHVPPSQRLFDTTNVASVSMPQSPFPYVTSESQILRGRDRASEEETDRIIALYYIVFLFSKQL